MPCNTLIHIAAMRIIISKIVRVVPLNFWNLQKKILGDGFLPSLGLPWASDRRHGGTFFWGVAFKQHPLFRIMVSRFTMWNAPTWCDATMVQCNIPMHQCGAWWCGAIPMHQCGAWWCGAIPMHQCGAWCCGATWQSGNAPMWCIAQCGMAFHNAGAREWGCV